MHGAFRRVLRRNGYFNVKSTLEVSVKVDADITAAMKAKNAPRLSALRMIKAAIVNKSVEKGRDLEDAEVLQVISSIVKQRRDSIVQKVSTLPVARVRRGDPLRFDVEGLREPQGEGVTLAADGTVYLAGEGGGGGTLAGLRCTLPRSRFMSVITTR